MTSDQSSRLSNLSARNIRTAEDIKPTKCKEKKDGIYETMRNLNKLGT